MIYIDERKLNDFDALGYESYELAYTSDSRLGIKILQALQAIEADYSGKFLPVVARDFAAKKCGYLLVYAADWEAFEGILRPLQSPSPDRQERYRMWMERLYARQTLMAVA